MQGEKHPLDFAALKKGDVITQDQIERIYQVRLAAEPDKYKLHALQLWQQIEDERDDLLVRLDGASLRIMVDVEADDVTYRRGERAVRSLVRNARRRAAINRAAFSDEQKRAAEVRDQHMTAIAIFTRKELRKAKREALLAATSEEPAE